MIDAARISIIRGGYFRCTPYWDQDIEKGGAKYEPSFAFFLPVNGEASMEAEGGRCQLVPGNIYFIPSYYMIRQTCKKEMRVYWIGFVSDSFFLTQRLLGIRGLYKLPLANVPGVEQVFRRFEDLFQDPRPVRCRDPKPDDSLVRKDALPGLALKAEGIVITLLGELIERTEGDFCWGNYRSLERLKPAVNFMDEAYLNSPPLAEIAKRASLAPNYFMRLFKQETGTTPFKYMENRRLDLARKLLFDPRLKVLEVAQQSGYHSLYYFSRAFKRRFGAAPSDMRQIPQPLSGGGQTVKAKS